MNNVTETMITVYRKNGVMLKGSLTVRGVGMYMSLLERNYKVKMYKSIYINKCVKYEHLLKIIKIDVY